MNTTQRIDVPVLVIGNGPVGQTTALLLAHHGVRSLVIDQAPERSPIGSKAIAQQRDVLDVWDALDGVGRQVAAEGVTWSRSRTYHRGHELFSTTWTGDGAAFPPFVNISQARTEQLLDERIAVSDLVEVRWGVTATGFAQDDDSVTVTCSSAEGPLEIRAEHVVAAVGSRGNLVREALGVTFDGRTFDDQFLICDVKADVPGWETERRFHFDPVWNPGRQVLIHPCPDSTYRIDWQVPDTYDLGAEEADGRLDQRIRAIIGEPDYEVVWKSVYRFHSRVASRLRVGRVLLAGDAAHLVAPFGGRGLNSGVQDAENAAWKIAEVHAGRGGDALLESYHDERHAAALENLAVTSETMDFLVPQDDAQAAHRLDVLERALADTAALAEVNSGRLAEPFWYSDSALTSPAAHRPATGRPPVGQVPPPAPGVLVPDAALAPDAPAERLRLLLRAGFTVLIGRAVDLAAFATLPDPVRVLLADDLAPGLAERLGLQDDEAWLVRPDAHLAACLVQPSGAEAAAAFNRALGVSLLSGVNA